MSDHTHWIANDGEYQAQIFYTEGAEDVEHPTEWLIFHSKQEDPVAKGWAPTPRAAREEAEKALVALVAGKASGE